MNTDYCAYPPQLADDVEITEQRDGDRLAFSAGSAAVGRYILLREAERRVLSLLEDSLTPAALSEEFTRRHGAKLPPATLAKFLTKLDEVGILAGERAAGFLPPEQQLGTQFYSRFKLFNPDPLFTRLVVRLRWIWTMPFFVCSLLLMLATAALALMNSDEVVSYGGYTLREHYLAIVIAGLIVGVRHEFAHGLTRKAFGGRATEVGGLLIYYFLPALYCNVSGLHLIPQRGRRLWVIAAGVYWQLLVGTLALLAWFALVPYTLLADLAFIFFCGSVLDVAFNGNPLIKLDGYYFLSQWLRLPNLMDRSRAYWRGLLRRILLGERNEAGARFSLRERMILAVFGLLSFGYTLALTCFIVIYLGAYLIEWFHLPGRLLTGGLALFYVRRPLKQLLAAGKSFAQSAGQQFFNHRVEGNMTSDEQTMTNMTTQPKSWRRVAVPAAICLALVTVLLLPWNAPVGNDGTLGAIPGQEAIIRAPESGTLIALRVQPGEQVKRGAPIGKLGNLEVEEQLVQVQTELARANADYDRLFGELRAHGEKVARAETQLRQRRHAYDEINAEQQQIETKRRTEANAVQYLTASVTPATTLAAPSTANYPAALAVLQSEVELRRARLAEASTQLDRARKLYAQGLAPRSELDAAETRATALTIELSSARDRLEAALIEHRRQHTSLATEVQLARADAVAGALPAASGMADRFARSACSTVLP